MVAIITFVIGILGAYKLQLHATHGNALADRVSTSTSWATYAVEELIGREYDDPLLDDDSNPTGSSGLDVMDDTADGVIYICGLMDQSSEKKMLRQMLIQSTQFTITLRLGMLL